MSKKERKSTTKPTTTEEITEQSINKLEGENQMEERTCTNCGELITEEEFNATGKCTLCLDQETEEQPIEVAAPIIVKAMEAITAVVADRLSVVEKWKLLLDIMAKTDESSLPIEQCSQAELNRRLKLLASQKTAEKKIDDNSDLFKAIVAKEDAIKALKVNVGRSGGTRVSADMDPAGMDQTQLTAYIRGIQSKKCTLKKVLLATPVGTDAYKTVSGQMDEVLKQEAAAIELRKLAPAGESAHKTKKVSKEMETKISTVLAALGQLEQTPEVQKQIQALQELLG